MAKGRRLPSPLGGGGLGLNGRLSSSNLRSGSGLDSLSGLSYGLRRRLDLSRLLLLLLFLLPEEVAEDRGPLTGTRAALGLLLGGLFLGSLLNGLSSFLAFLGGLLLGRLGDFLSLLLLLLGRRRLQRLEGLLVGLALRNGGGERLGLLDLKLQLSDPVVTLGSADGLEGMLVTLGGESELVGTLRGGLRGVGLC